MASNDTGQAEKNLVQTSRSGDSEAARLRTDRVEPVPREGREAANRP